MILLKDIILILFLAVIIIMGMSRFKVSPVIGFLITGILIGPSVFNIIKSVSEIEILAEIGIIILLFNIGLEFSLDKIKAIKRYFFQFGSIQVVFSWIIFTSILVLIDLPIYQSLFGGFILSLSSTAIILKILQDSNEVTTPYGSKITGILLFQDAAIIPFIIILPIIFQTKSIETSQMLLQMATTVGGLIIIFFAGKFLFPKVFATILRVKVPELLMVTVIIFLFGTAIISHELGSSMAMGAFIAGVAISDSDYSHQISEQILPSQHIFNSIFFISIGMFINTSFFFSNIFEILVITLIIVLIKVAVIYLIFWFFKYPLSEGFVTAFSLANIGEFAFILFAMAQKYVTFDQELHQMLLSCAVLSMLTIPLFIKLGKTLGKSENLQKEIIPDDLSKSFNRHTIIAGFGINGQNIARILKTLNIPYVIIEANPITVSRYKELGEPIYYGDLVNKHNLENLGIGKAALLVVAISDIEALKRSVVLAKKLNPKIKIISRSLFFNQVEDLYHLGADLVLSQDIETSLTCIHHVLKFYNMPEHIARTQTNLLRKEHYQFFVKDELQESWKIAMFDFIQQDSELFFIAPSSKLVNKTLGSLEPYNYKKMKIIGIIRKDKIITDIIGEFQIEEFDTIIFSGNHKEVANAIIWMEDNN